MFARRTITVFYFISIITITKSIYIKKKGILEYSEAFNTTPMQSMENSEEMQAIELTEKLTESKNIQNKRKMTDVSSESSSTTIKKPKKDPSIIYSKIGKNQNEGSKYSDTSKSLNPKKQLKSLQSSSIDSNTKNKKPAVEKLNTKKIEKDKFLNKISETNLYSKEQPKNFSIDSKNSALDSFNELKKDFCICVTAKDNEQKKLKYVKYLQNIFKYFQDDLPNLPEFKGVENLLHSIALPSDQKNTEKEEFIINVTYSGNIIYKIFNLEIEIFEKNFENKFINIENYKNYILYLRPHIKLTKILKSYYKKLFKDGYEITFKQLFDVLIKEKECLVYFFQPFYIFTKIISNYDENIVIFVNNERFKKIVTYCVCLNHVITYLKIKVNKNINIFQLLLDSISIDQDIKEKLQVVNYLIFSIISEVNLIRKDKSITEYFFNLDKFLTESNINISPPNIELIINNVTQTLDNIKNNLTDHEITSRAFLEIKENIVELENEEHSNKKKLEESDKVATKKHLNKILSMAKQNFYKILTIEHESYVTKFSDIYLEFSKFNFNEINLFFCFTLSDDFLEMAKNITKENIEIFINTKTILNKDKPYFLCKSYENIFYIIEYLYDGYNIEKFEICYWINIFHLTQEILSKTCDDDFGIDNLCYNLNEIFKSIKVIQKKLLPFSDVVIYNTGA